jgi:hypothetical protein
VADRARTATVAVAVIAVLGVVLWVFVARRSTPRPSAPSASASDVANAPPTSPAPVTSPTPQPSTGDAARPRRHRFTAEDRQRRDRVRALIYRAFQKPPPPPPSATTSVRRVPLQPLGPNAPVLDKDYIRDRIQEDFKPLAKECYEAALEADASLGGKLVFSFTIVGDDSVGGIVESVDFAEGSDIEDDELLYCMRESLLSMTFAPPAKGGTVTVTYPMLFSPGDGG